MIKSHAEHSIYLYSLCQCNIPISIRPDISKFALITRQRELLFRFFFFYEIGIILFSNTLTDMPSNGTPAFDKNIC